MHMRKKRNVYTKFDKFWILKEPPARETDVNVVSKIAELQKQVHVFQPFQKRQEQQCQAIQSEKIQMFSPKLIRQIGIMHT